MIRNGHLISLQPNQMFSAKDALDIVNTPCTKYNLQNTINAIKTCAKQRKTAVSLYVETSILQTLKELGYTLEHPGSEIQLDGVKCVYVQLRWGPEQLTERESKRADAIAIYMAECKEKGIKPYECSVCDRICCDRDH